MPTSITCLNRIVPVSFRDCRISVHVWTHLHPWTEGAIPVPKAEKVREKGLKTGAEVDQKGPASQGMVERAGGADFRNEAERCDAHAGGVSGGSIVHASLWSHLARSVG